MNRKAIKNERGQYLANGRWTDRKGAERIYYTDEAIERARLFPAGSVTVVDIDDSDRVVWQSFDADSCEILERGEGDIERAIGGAAYYDVMGYNDGPDY